MKLAAILQCVPLTFTQILYLGAIAQASIEGEGT